MDRIYLILRQIKNKMKQYQFINEDNTPKSAWDSLSIAEKAEMIGVAVKNGITDLPTIRQKYNEFAEGGDVNDSGRYFVFGAGSMATSSLLNNN